MRKIMTTALAAMIAATSFSTLAVTSADAQPRHWRGPGPSGFHGPRPGYGPRYHGQRRYDRRGANWGAVAAGSIIGLAAGAAIGGSARNNDAVAYCQQRFRSYDVRTGTYLGYDGRRHACP